MTAEHDLALDGPEALESGPPGKANALDKEEIKRAFLEKLFYVQGKFPALATQHDYYMALAFLVRDYLLGRWVSTASVYTEKKSRTVAYLSAEFLLGPHLGNNLNNLGMTEIVRRSLHELGLNLDALLREEDEPGLGNGGLGRLAACYMDSMATLNVPTLGYGIRYEYGIFEQAIVNGWQVEKTDQWLRFGNPWDIPRPEWSVEVKLGGYTENFFLFGLTAAEVEREIRHGYEPAAIYHSNPLLREALDLIRAGHFSRGDTELFQPLIDNLLYQDPFLVLADFQSYVDCQDQIGASYRDSEHWTRMSILNSARSGKFSSDRAIRDYCRDIWKVEPVPVPLMHQHKSVRGSIQ